MGHVPILVVSWLVPGPFWDPRRTHYGPRSYSGGVLAGAWAFLGPTADPLWGLPVRFV